MTDDLRRLQELLGPHYLLGAELGRGGMATVYHARDLRHQRELAVKVIDPNLATSIGVERFQREIAIASSLQHPNIVPLFDSGGSGDLLYFIMPLVVGESLRHRLKREVQLPLPDALSIVRDVAAALTYAHEAGVVHRDIKPENILLSGGRAMVADFGIARAASSADGSTVTEVGLALGTPTYMSPEQAGGGAVVDARADIYALACVCYEMLAGEPPFTGRTAQALIARHLGERPPSLQIVRPTVTDAFQDAIERALAKVPADRFPSAKAFADALDAAYLAGISGGTRVTPRTPVATRPGPSRRTLARLAAVGVTVAGLALAARAIVNRDPPADADGVVVFPLSTPAAGLDPAAGIGVGEQVALMIESALEHTEPLRWLDGQALLGSERAADARLISSEAVRLARRAGARYYVDGAVITDRDSLTVIVRLHDAVGDSLVRQESATGAMATTSAPQLALRSLARILPRLLPPNGRVDLSYLADRSPAAIADWLQGERAYAHGRHRDALDFMYRALASDSAMSVAALKGAQAAVYLQDYPLARDLVAGALRQEGQLPRHHLALAHGLRLFLAGAADSAVAAFTSARAADTTWSEPWMMLAEVYNHMYPVGSTLDSLAERALRQALALQPGFAPAVSHLIEYEVRRGDAPAARALLKRLAAIGPDTLVVFQAELLVRCALDGPEKVDWPDAVRRASTRVVDVARIVGGGDRYPDCARRALEAVITHDADTTLLHSNARWAALKGLDYLAMLRGHADSARDLIDAARARGVRAAVSLHVLNAMQGSTASEASADTAMRSLADRPISQMSGARLRYLTLWSWHRHDVARLDSLVRRLAVVVDSADRGVDRALLLSATARAALLRGDSSAALVALKQVRPAADPSFLTWDLWESAAEERILLAELQLATGDAEGAITTAEFFDSSRSQIDLLHLAASLRVRSAAATRLGRRREALAYAARLEAPR
ncbi:MAG: protein kinase [Gemmatimonadetes bacterium]|nr:protein kinase [Gemmatimonadota bacterium]